MGTVSSAKLTERKEELTKAAEAYETAIRDNTLFLDGQRRTLMNIRASIALLESILKTDVEEEPANETPATPGV